VPSNCTKVTAFVDVHDKVLFWVVCAWEGNFTGYVIDYGTHPDQRRGHFTTRALAKELRSTAGADAAICAGLEHIIAVLLGSMWMRDDGVAMKVDRLLVDKNYKPNVVEAAVRRVDSGIVRMTRGMAVTAAKKPFSEYNHKPGQQLGHHWMVPSLRGIQRGTLRYVAVDVNYWKSFAHASLALGAGAPGNLSLYGDKRTDHRLFAEHIVKSETWRLITDNTSGRVVAEWAQYPSKPDNHWLDCLVGCAVAASMCGSRLAGADFVPRRPRKKYTQADLMRKW
jgi:hypothetical protein